ncbi:hypothetical protein CJ217_01805 [Streptococcus sp. UMB1385]|nr:hypothetical protein CJ217_01805 [Streptococcus sp. UMB1385]
MTNEELEQKVKRLEEQLTEVRIELLERKADKKSYEVKVPEDIGDYYFVSELGAITLLKDVFFSAGYEKVYQRGLAFKNRKELEQYDKERILLFKLRKWADWRNGDWYPDWNNGDDKFSIYYFYNTESFSVCSDWNCNTFSKLPYFKSEELAREFIEEFGDEIKEVLC